MIVRLEISGGTAVAALAIFVTLILILATAGAG